MKKLLLVLPLIALASCESYTKNTCKQNGNPVIPKFENGQTVYHTVNPKVELTVRNNFVSSDIDTCSVEEVEVAWDMPDGTRVYARYNQEYLVETRD